MHIIPVLDLKAGRAVHAVRGERERYAPVESRLVSGGDALALAAAYRDRLGCRTCYVADLDAIRGQPGHTGLIRAIAGLGLALWVDAGISTPVQAKTLAGAGAAMVIVGSETLSSTTDLAVLTRHFPPNQLVLSVDLQHGLLRVPPGIDSPHQLVKLAAEAGLSRAILLDLARVGAAAGPPLDLLLQLRPQFPDLSFYAGGGVRSTADLEALAEAGAAGALVATALHRGDLTAADLQGYQL